jgi:hypothetical protein
VGMGKFGCEAMNVILTMKAKYFGIEVELLCQLNHCSLVRFKDRSFVVDTADLVLESNFKLTAGAATTSKAA